LQREELVKVIGISKLIRYLLQKFEFKDKHEKDIMKNLSNAITWDEAPAASSEVVMVCSVSAKNMHKLIVDLYEGKLDYVCVEMADESSAKKSGGSSMLSMANSEWPRTSRCRSSGNWLNSRMRPGMRLVTCRC
jgi:hypothetical protein